MMGKQRILMSACLLGEPVRYDGGHSKVASGLIQQWQDEGRILSTCPEMAGGLNVPRIPAEIIAGNADAVLQGQSLIQRKDGGDVTDAYISGAEKTLALCMQYKVQIAILKEGSPSCGVICVHDGSFSGHKVDGQGITARLLSRHGISVFNEAQIHDAATRLSELEHRYP